MGEWGNTLFQGIPPSNRRRHRKDGTDNRFSVYMANMDNPSERKEKIPHTQFPINKTNSASSNLSPNEIVKGFTPDNTTDILLRRP
jgi:hypothetical protein